MRTQQLRYFESVARNLSFTKAAEECYVAQPAISQQIKALEDELGFPLFERTTKGVFLTDAGRAYYDDVVGILDALDQATDRARAISTGSEGVLTVGLGNSGQAGMLGELKRFSDSFPDVRIEFRRVRSLQWRMQLMRGEFDLTLMSPQSVETCPDVEFIELKSSPLRMVMSRDHPLASAEQPLSTDELCRYPHIVADSEGGAFARSVYPYLKDHPETPLITCEDQGICIAVVTMGFGVAAMPEDILPSLSEGCVVREVEGYEASMESGWAFQRGARNPALRKFVSFIS